MPPGRNRRQRRRRAAAVGGLAYQAGKRRAEPQAPPPAEAQAPPQAPEPAPPSPASGSGALSPEAMQQLEQLAQLHEEGALTDEEFQQQKAKLLAG